MIARLNDNNKAIALFVYEFKRATVYNIFFWVSLVILSGFAILAAVQSIAIGLNTLVVAKASFDEANQLYSLISTFTFWMPLRTSEFISGSFFLVWPLLIALAYSWSEDQDMKSKVAIQLIARTSKKAYSYVKASIGFIVAFLLLFWTYLLNFLLIALFFPLLPVDIFLELYIGVNEYSLFASLFFNQPLLYVFVWTIFCGCIAGIWALLVAYVTSVFKSFAKAYIACYLFLIALGYIGQFIQYLRGFEADDFIKTLLFSINFMHLIEGGAQVYQTSVTMLIISVALIFVVLLYKITHRADVL